MHFAWNTLKEHGLSEQGWAGDDGGLIRYARRDKWGHSDRADTGLFESWTSASQPSQFNKFSHLYRVAWT